MQPTHLNSAAILFFGMLSLGAIDTLFELSPDPVAGSLNNTQNAEIFWGEMAPCQHVAQIYESDRDLLNNLTSFVAEGIKAGESTIVVASPDHLGTLQEQLRADHIDLSAAIVEDRFILLDAETALARFMIKQWPDEQLFFLWILEILERATVNNRRVRAFGEMVALLWARGDTAATVHLEFLWEQLRKSHAISLFCAYPKAGFTKHPSQSIAEICAAHARVF